MLNFVEIILFNEQFSYRVISVLRQKGVLCLKKSDRTGAGVSELVLLDCGVLPHIIIFFLFKMDCSITVFMCFVFVVCIKTIHVICQERIA